MTSHDDRERDTESAPPVSDTDTLVAEPEEFPIEKKRLHQHEQDPNLLDENSALLSQPSESKDSPPQSSTWHLIPKGIATTFVNSVRFVLSTLAAPGVYLIACLYDQTGNFAPLLQLKKLFGLYNGNPRNLAPGYDGVTADEKSGGWGLPATSGVGSPGVMAGRFPRSASRSSSSGLSSESESERDRAGGEASSSSSRGNSGRHSRSKSLQDSEEIAPARRSIRIKLHSDEALRQRKHRKAQSASSSHGSASSDGNLAPADISAQLKSPMSPVGALTRYPKSPAPPRPLIPRRQPSYINIEPADRKHQKTLILDLDETLIHSMSKGGRMSTGHMVEVRLNTTYVGVGGQASIGPQHPILYYVHKRPYCDDFLRRVCKWYNLVIFTASVQEYADPVIDWLETERKYFSGRFYRQHCTFRHGAFIKDLSSVEPDLSKVMILDNSPLSYLFHQDNAIPIQGWINDPTDNDLLHLVPLLEGLQYVSDVRALLALRGGEDGQHMA